MCILYFLQLAVVLFDYSGTYLVSERTCGDYIGFDKTINSTSKCFFCCSILACVKYIVLQVSEKVYLIVFGYMMYLC